MTVIQIYGLAAPFVLVGIVGALAWWNLRQAHHADRRPSADRAQPAE
jgi:hypothetical protein